MQKREEVGMRKTNDSLLSLLRSEILQKGIIIILVVLKFLAVRKKQGYILT